MSTVEPAAPAPQIVPVAARLRLDAVDFVRGLVMILMVLDHTRDFVHRGGMFADPLDPTTTTPILYLTRWVTHLCAPTFVLLAGLGVGLRRLRGASDGDTAWFLLTRGLWLLVMELVVMRTIIWWNVEVWEFAAFLQVIWAIGLSMVMLSAIVRLPLAAIGAIGAVIVLGHNLFDGIRVPFWFPGTLPPPSSREILWMLVHQSGFFPLGGADGAVVFARYPVVPWFGLLCIGYVMAAIYRWEAATRVRFLATSALVMLAAFVVLRGFNLYGNPTDWAPQPTFIQSAMALMNVEKYPPSLAYVLATLLPALTLLALLDGRTIAGGLRGAVVTFGRVPFFFYILQWITSHVTGMAVTALAGRSIAPYFDHLLGMVTTQPQPDFGGPLWAVYVCWLLSLLAMYPLCRWFAGVKARRRAWWLSYL